MAAMWEFERDYSNEPEAAPGIRGTQLFSAFFGPMDFLARQEGDTITILDFTWDPDYWETIGNDPGEDD